MLIPQEIIEKKASGLKLSTSELQAFFSAYESQEVSEAQCSALLMAIRLNGFSESETIDLTDLMIQSGQPYQRGQDQAFYCDKHSTGGLGDKTSFILFPLCLLEGLRVPMIAGRGLGYTGGTIDKLESIPGFQTDLSMEKQKSQLTDLGGFIISQTKDLAPLDGRLYALRDVTGTVRSIPLICASILSKKISEGLHSLVMDVKTGSGAFMKTFEDAKSLALLIQNVAKSFHLKVSGVISDMNSPLGETVGHSLELWEVAQILLGKKQGPCLDLSLYLASKMIQGRDIHLSLEEIIAKLHQHIHTGRAWNMFSQFVISQGGDPRFLEDIQKENFSQTLYKKEVLAQSSGWIKKIDTERFGMAMILLGGGRTRTAGTLNHKVGISHILHVGDQVHVHQPLCVIHGADEESLYHAISLIEKAYDVEEERTEAPSVIFDFF